jgi:raffinose/stachyose/melibiose transport system permease protein
LLPGVLIFLAIVVLPLLLSIRYSFFDWNFGKDIKFIGFGNYARLIKDTDFWFSFRNNLIIVAVCAIGQIGFALLLCGLFTSNLLRLREFHRAVIFIPVVLSAVVVGFLWTLIYNKDMGLLNMLLKALKLQWLIRPWLDDPNIVIYSVSAPLVWQYIGEYLVIFMAAIQGIDPAVLEVAQLDGCTGFKKMRYIVMPLISDTVIVAVMLCIAGNMKVFDSIYVMTGGGPGTSSMVMAQYAYKTSFEQFKLGYGSTISVGILVLSMGLVLLSRKLGGRRNHEIS